MWFEERSWSLNHMKMSSLVVEEWRDIWSYKTEFMLIGLSYLFATTNFLNLPRLVLENGGLAFLAAYAVALFVVVLPIIVMELSIGQLTGRAPVQALFNVCPTFKGVGISQILFTFIVLAYMSKYLAWLFIYIFYLFWSIIDDRPGLPWLNCKSFPELQTPKILCRESSSIRNVGIARTTTTSTTTITTATNSILNLINSTTDLYKTTIENLLNQGASEISNDVLSTIAPVINNVASKIKSNVTSLVEPIGNNITEALSLVSSSIDNTAAFVIEQQTNAHNQLNTLHKESAISHFMRILENPSSNIKDFGDFQLYFVFAECAIWFLVFIVICFGVRWLGKVIMLTFVGPFVLLIAFSGRCIFLAGAVEMFQKFFEDYTNWDKLYDYMVWKTAVEQAILASGIGFGAFITIGSYNKRSNNLVYDSILLVFGHIVITFFQLTAIISLVGYINYRTGLTPNELIEHGENQMWQIIVYVSFLPHTKIFTAILLIFCAVGLLNVFYVLSLSILATLEDALGERWTRCFPRFILALFVVLLNALFSAYFATQAGKYAYELTSGYIKYITLEMILTFELLAIAWFYCAHSLGKDLKTMLDSSFAWCFGYFLLIFTYILPIVPVAIGALNILTYSHEKYSTPIRDWDFSELIGILIAIVPLLPIPIFAFVTICSSCNYPSQASKFQRLRHAFRSPMHYELMKSTEDTKDAVGGRNLNDAISPRYSAAAPGYVLLPQQVTAPLAQPENYHLDSTNIGGVNTTTSTTTTASAHTTIPNNSRANTVERQQQNNSNTFPPI